MKIDNIVLALLFTLALAVTFALTANVAISLFAGAILVGFQLAMNWVIADISESFTSW